MQPSSPLDTPPQTRPPTCQQFRYVPFIGSLSIHLGSLGVWRPRSCCRLMSNLSFGLNLLSVPVSWTKHFCGIVIKLDKLVAAQLPLRTCARAASLSRVLSRLSRLSVSAWCSHLCTCSGAQGADVTWDVWQLDPPISCWEWGLGSEDRLDFQR